MLALMSAQIFWVYERLLLHGLKCVLWPSHFKDKTLLFAKLKSIPLPMGWCNIFQKCFVESKSQTVDFDEFTARLDKKFQSTLFSHLFRMCAHLRPLVLWMFLWFLRERNEPTCSHIDLNIYDELLIYK